MYKYLDCMFENVSYSSALATSPVCHCEHFDQNCGLGRFFFFSCFIHLASLMTVKSCDSNLMMSAAATEAPFQDNVTDLCVNN